MLTLSPSRAHGDVLEHLAAGLASVQEAVLAPLAPAERTTFLRLIAKLR